MLTYDRAIVTVQVDGSIHSYRLQSFGSIDFDHLPDSYTRHKDEVDQALAEKLKEIYDDDRLTVSCDLKSVRCMNYNNQFAVEYQYGVDVKSGTSGYSELTTLIVVFDE